MFSQKNSYRVKRIPVVQIKPNRSQPRVDFSVEELESLKDSIKENGILQPLTVRKITASEYELISGERRLRASIMAGLEEVPCILMECDEKQSAIFALLENLQREDLNPFEEAEGIQRLIIDLSITQEEAAVKLGKKQSTIANKLRLLKFKQEERVCMIESGLSERHARALLKLKDEEDRKIALGQIIAKGLNVQQTEEFVKQMLMKDQTKLNMESSHRKVIIKDVRIFMNTIDRAIHTMRVSGIDAISEQNETDEYLEYTVKIPKKSAIQKRLA